MTHPGTRTVHQPVPATAGSTPLGVPLYQGHTFSFADTDAMAEAFQGPGAPYVYARYGNPTIDALESTVADLENGAGAIASASGMGAISATLWALLDTGGHVVAQDRLYGGTQDLLDALRTRWGIEVTRVDGGDPESVRAALRPDTRVLFLETISNPTGQVVDLPVLTALARAVGATTVVDNTFATPLLCRPLEHGADVVVHSATKYMGGHSDTIGGVAVFADPDTLDTVRSRTAEFGAVMDPFAAWLVSRGLSTLAVRMERHCANAQELAERLAAHPAVARVRYPGLPEDPGHATARRILDGGFGGVLAFDLAGGLSAGRSFASRVRLAALAPSLGDVRTLVMHPATTSHRQLDAEGLAAAGISVGLIRVSVGIEDVEDLWRDLEQALS
ncbi:aminotransferase class I/II-fold pyridoxal phosphate-dependent enzyme [Nocardiopsis sp. N85]|uniref:trans-sulfuration enzyme family protein n=1 Tax=Nocardiopsis sp. N85 TaxID=3029400 RepID=UPI00237F4322|nr:aminotransferase class I/II-fold pyridoxal phosphate-dependent enzyme [Nocardiopsis sp. N85]MDE3720609.1 aminotransferase class I/II-fold pyridoxal phosphate-dependent enzyme [Nocardiopsis sp. N85]